MNAEMTALASRLGELGRAHGLEAVIAVGPGTVRRLAGYWARSARMNPKRPGIVVWPVGGEPVLLVGADQVSVPRRDSWIADVRGYAERGRRPAPAIARAVADAVADRGLAGARIGVEVEAISALLYHELAAALPDAELVGGDAICEALRVQLDGEALRIVRAGSVAAEHGILAALQRARPGCTETALAAAIAHEITGRGVSDVRYVLLGAGPGARGFMPPTNRPMRRGELIRIDLLAVIDGYFIDLGRMACVGQPNPAQTEAYERQLELNRRIIAAIGPGVAACEVFAVGEREAASLGLELLDQPLIGVGHVIGVNPKDVPMLKASEDDALAAGMVLNLEADTIGPDGAIMHLEDMILVTDAGCELLSDSLDWTSLPRLGAEAIPDVARSAAAGT
jgi:Xaa-Pro aminopeptidase